MREATLECDKWVRHNDVMTALRELAKSIYSVSQLLDDMKSNIATMNNEIVNFAQNNAKSQERLLSETKSARYAMESVQRSAEKLAYYEELKRKRIF